MDVLMGGEPFGHLKTWGQKLGQWSPWSFFAVGDVSGYPWSQVFFCDKEEMTYCLRVACKTHIIRDWGTVGVHFFVLLVVVL